MTGALDREPFADLSADLLATSALPDIFRQQAPEPREVSIPEPEPKLEPEVAAAAIGAVEIPEPAPPETDAGSGATATLGALYLAQGHLTDARRTFEQVLERDPRDVEARAGLAEVDNRLQADQAVEPSDEQVSEAPTGKRSAKIARLERYLSRIRSAAERLSA